MVSSSREPKEEEEEDDDDEDDDVARIELILGLIGPVLKENAFGVVIVVLGTGKEQVKNLII